MCMKGDSDDFIDGRYRLLQRLGAGGMGEVWRAEHVVTGRHVALKLLRGVSHSDAELLRFEREARAIGRLSSRHVVQVLDAGVDRTRAVPYIALELLNG